MFELLEARTNRQVLAKLANAIAVVRGSDVPVIFDAEYKRGMVGAIGMGGSTPQLFISSAAISADIVGEAIDIKSQASALTSSWVIAAREPDGETEIGLALLHLVRP
jgi:hypothetical protein